MGKWSFDLHSVTYLVSHVASWCASWHSSGRGNISFQFFRLSAWDRYPCKSCVTHIFYCEKYSSSSPVKCSSKHLQFYNHHLEAQKFKLMQTSDFTGLSTGLGMKWLFYVIWSVEMNGLLSVCLWLNLHSVRPSRKALYHLLRRHQYLKQACLSELLYSL